MNSPLWEEQAVRLRHCRYGVMLYLAQDRYIGKSLDTYGEFSDAECDLFKQVVPAGGVVVEVGSNIGSHTVMLARQVGPSGRVFAFEPQRFIFQILCANLALNSLTNVHTHHAAVGSGPGTLIVPNLDYSALNNFGGLGLGSFKQGEPVAVQTIDSLQLSHCNLLKIDVEGMESAVLSGATETITRCRPVLYFENDRVENSPTLLKQVLDLGYRLYWHLPPLFQPGNFFNNQENIFPGVRSINVLALHGSVPQNIQGMREILDPNESWQ